CMLLDAAGLVVGTSTAWYEDDYYGQRVGRVHWVAIHPSVHGRGLSKPLLAASCQRLVELGHEKGYLWTHAHRLAALHLYLTFGFIPDVMDADQALAWMNSLQKLNWISPAIHRYNVQDVAGRIGQGLKEIDPAVWKPTPACSPSFVHQKLVKANKPKLAYAGGSVKAWQNRLRPVVRQKLGLDVMPTLKSPPKVQSIWKRQHPLGAIEKLLITTEPGAEMPAYLCLPRGVVAPYTPWICLQGHAPGFFFSLSVDPHREVLGMPYEAIDAGDRDFALDVMKNGHAALCLEQRCFGQRQEKLLPGAENRSWCGQGTMHALMLGRTMIGERVFDVDRAIDYLAARKDMDLAKLGVMGNSGGGTVSLFSAALLPRIRFTIPSCYFCTFADSIMSIEHCVDNYVPGLLPQAEMADVMGLFAPRPVVIVAGKDDDIFPLPGVLRAYAQLKKIYKAAGAADQCQLVVGDGGHRFYSEQAWAAMLPMIAAAPAPGSKKSTKKPAKKSTKKVAKKPAKSPNRRK
ncbi:MAG: GNAT family N-acetyltransferase, partial [Phycisphaeraceae bacterium]|nr:GNAT family N-acetyltransferase [Phycisphaeraceae bacterium]